MKHPAPNPAGISAPHFRAAGEGRLVLPCCTSCRRFHWPARAYCPQCRGDVTWRDASGKGRVATFSVVRRAADPALAEEAPYIVAFVALDEGVRIFGNLVGVAPESVQTGMRVRVGFEPALDASLRVPVFAPDTTAAHPRSGTGAMPGKH